MRKCSASTATLNVTAVPFETAAGDTTQTTHSQPPRKQNATAKPKEAGLWHFWPHVPCVWAASRKPQNANVRIAGVRPGSSRESSSPCGNSLGFSSVLLNGFHFTTAIKDQYVGRYNDPISLLLASPYWNISSKGKLTYIEIFLIPEYAAGC